MQILFGYYQSHALSLQKKVLCLATKATSTDKVMLPIPSNAWSKLTPNLKKSLIMEEKKHISQLKKIKAHCLV